MPKSNSLLHFSNNFQYNLQFKVLKIEWEQIHPFGKLQSSLLLHYMVCVQQKIVFLWILRLPPLFSFPPSSLLSVHASSQNKKS